MNNLKCFLLPSWPYSSYLWDFLETLPSVYTTSISSLPDRFICYMTKKVGIFLLWSVFRCVMSSHPWTINSAFGHICFFQLLVWKSLLAFHLVFLLKNYSGKILCNDELSMILIFFVTFFKINSEWYEICGRHITF